MVTNAESIDWVRAYNDLHWLLTLQRASRDLGLSAAQEQLLIDLYGRSDERTSSQS
ncbi:MAG TPA: hypothetical protein VFK47_15185 [Ktedonobacteraceae bacterium]|nr:hypothetical protein [Ktedonobacteraceae bacterium]